MKKTYQSPLDRLYQHCYTANRAKKWTLRWHWEFQRFELPKSIKCTFGNAVCWKHKLDPRWEKPIGHLLINCASIVIQSIGPKYGHRGNTGKLKFLNSQKPQNWHSELETFESTKLCQREKTHWLPPYRLHEQCYIIFMVSWSLTEGGYVDLANYKRTQLIVPSNKRRHMTMLLLDPEKLSRPELPKIPSL